MSALARLSPRERVLVLGVLPLAALAALWAFAWVPLEAARAERTREIAAYRLLVEAARGAGAAPVAAPAPAEPLAVRVTAGAEAAGLDLSRLEPEGARLRVAVPEAPFPTLMLWLADLEEARGVRLAAVEIDRRPAPGLVSARVLLEDAP